jgi:hypothetical protein
LNDTGGPLTVNFTLDRGGFNAGQALNLEIAGDRAFSAVRLSRTSLAQSLPVDLENGVYYWRVYPGGRDAAGDAVSVRLSLIDGSPPELISPAPDQQFSF